MLELSEHIPLRRLYHDLFFSNFFKQERGEKKKVKKTYGRKQLENMFAWEKDFFVAALFVFILHFILKKHGDD